jgi:hypothetical protein
MVEIQQMFIHGHKLLEFHILHANNILPIILIMEYYFAKKLINVKIAPGLHVQLVNPVKTNAGLLISRSTMFPITLKYLDQIR